MEKLELRHLACYLPYGLKMTSAASGRGAYITTIKRRLKKIETLTPELIEVMLFLNRKPILRPLSDLIKPIKVEGYNDGKEFVPITELMELMENYELEHLQKYKFGSNNGIYGILYCDTEGFECNFAYHEKTKHFGLLTTQDGIPHTVLNQYDLFQKLFEWHFNVFNLPEHLYIDINAIKK